MSNDISLFDRIVEGLYEAAFDPAGWPVVWDQVAKWLGAASGSLYLEDRSSGRVDPLAMPGWPKKAQTLYLAHYKSVDPYANFGRRTTPALRAILGAEVISAADYERSEIWNDLGRRYMDAYQFLAAFIPVEGSAVGMLGFHRPHDARPFDEDERGRLDRLLPHLQCVVQLGRRIGAERQQAAIRAAVLDSAGVAMMVVTADGGLVFANAAAEQLTRQSGLLLGSGRAVLRAAHRDEDRRLRALIADAANGGVGGALLVSCPHGSRLVILVSRLPHRAEHLWPAHLANLPLALVTIRATTEPNPEAMARLASLFGLTPAEADVLARLVAGRTVDQIAGDRRASPLTVRSQIRHLLLKCGAQSLRDLVRMTVSLG